MAAALFKAAPGGPRPHPLALEPEAALVEEPAAPPVAPLGDPRTTRYAGAFLLYAALARVDLWGVFRRLAVTTGPARWYGWAHTVAAIVCGFGLRFRSIEDLKNALRADLGVLLGTAQAPTVLVLRQKIRFLAQMYARFSPQQVVHAVGRGCGCAGSRYSAVKSSVAQSTAACAAPAIGGGPARRQPAPPQGAEALALTGRRTMKARGTRPRLSTTFYRWAKPSLTLQPPWNRQAPCDSAVYCGRIFREPATPLQIQTVFSSHVTY